MELSIVICTYNRAAELKKCLDSLQDQVTEKIEILVIDNNSKDETKALVLKYQNKIPNLFYYLEINQGHSPARNRGYYESNSDWILYIDDDGIAFPDLIQNAFKLIRLKYDIIGGIYFPYYNSPKPHWLPSTFGSNDAGLVSLKSVKIGDTYIPSGGVFLIRKSTLKALGEFNMNLDLSGDSNYFGEDTDMVLKAVNSNYNVAIDPQLKIYHLVQEYKYKISWHIINKYKTSKSYYFITKKSIFPAIVYFIRGNTSTIVKRIPFLIFKKGYFWQNFVIEASYPFSVLLGAATSKFR